MIGLNIREPFATLIAIGSKTVETRTYPIPDHLIGKRLAIVATGSGKAKVVGTVVFSGYCLYSTVDEFRANFAHHLVAENSHYDWAGKPKYAWHVSDAVFFREHKDAPSKTGMIWRKNCCIE